MALKAGTIPDTDDPALLAAALEDSMTQAMEKAFVNQWPNVMGEQEIPVDRQQMRLMFVAIAQGVIQHLKENPDAFKVQVTLAGNVTANGTVTVIE